MSDDVLKRIDELDDKNAIYVAQKLAEAVFKHVKAPSFDAMARTIDETYGQSGLTSEIAQHQEWAKATLKAGEAGQAARAVLRAWATDSGLTPAVGAAIDEFKTSKQDLGIFSVPLALGLTYALIAMDLDVDLGFVKVKKRGLSGAEQVGVVTKTIEPVLRALGAAAGN